MNNQKTWSEKIEVSGREAVDKVKELVQQGNVRRLIIYKSDDSVLLEIPLTASAVGAGAMLVLMPQITALGMLVAFLAKVRIEVIREEEMGEKPKNESKSRIEVD